MGQLVGGYGAEHADHQPGEDPGGDVMADVGTVAGGDQVMAGELAQRGAEAEDIAIADAP
ncbi:hypothetical protein D3C85_1834870 [compost metagenome]